MLFSYVEIPLFSWQHSIGQYKDEEKKNFFADTPDKL
jgi:hypothetical protein